MWQPVAGVVTVTSVDGRQVARTKADGTVGYTVSDLRPGTYMLIVTAPVISASPILVAIDGQRENHQRPNEQCSRQQRSTLPATGGGTVS